MTTKQTIDIKPVVNTVKSAALQFMMKSIGSYLPEMGTDCYMNVRTWINNYRIQIKDNNEMHEIDCFINDNWTWKKDSISGQSKKVQEALVKLHNFISNL